VTDPIVPAEPAQLAPGIYPSVSFADYLAWDRYGSSDLRAFRAGPPAMVPYRREHRDEQTDATRFGTACHAAILTPHLYRAQYVTKPDGMSFATKEGKAWREENGRGREILSFHDGVCVQGVAEAFMAAPILLVNAEASLAWDDASGLPCKGRPDWHFDNTVYDLKVSVHAAKGLAVLTYRAYAEGWMHQLAHNRAGLNEVGVACDHGRLVVIAPKPPHLLWLLEVKDAALDILEMENERTRAEMAVCHRAGFWPGTPREWIKVEPPQYAVAETLAALDVSGAEEVDGE
jgi:hypothetical protein